MPEEDAADDCEQPRVQRIERRARDLVAVPMLRDPDEPRAVPVRPEVQPIAVPTGRRPVCVRVVGPEPEVEEDSPTPDHGATPEKRRERGVEPPSGQPHRADPSSTLRNARGVSSAGRAPALQAGGRRFDPGTLHFRRPSRRRRHLSFAGAARGASGPRAGLSHLREERLGSTKRSSSAQVADRGLGREEVVVNLEQLRKQARSSPKPRARGIRWPPRGSATCRHAWRARSLCSRASEGSPVGLRSFTKWPSSRSTRISTTTRDVRTGSRR